MTRLFIIVLTAIVFHVRAQSVYEQHLNQRLEDIADLPAFDNTLVLFDNTGWIPWQYDLEFLTNEIVSHEYATYRALADNKNTPPDNSKQYWKLIVGPHPYLFLRDTAKTEDLLKLVTSDNPYIKTYAFGALAFRNHDDVYTILVNNLSDTTKIKQFTFDMASTEYTSHLMIQSALKVLTKEQKKNLKKIIQERCAWLKESAGMLEE